eukprot:gene19932-21884_t
MDNIRVAIRVRPLIQREVSRDADSNWKVEDNTIFQVENGIPLPNNIINPTAFTFDKVYTGSDSTVEIYDTFAKPVVIKAMRGVNGTIFAYGQTGTGKTYTMMGLPTNSGVIPRSINEIFEFVNTAPDREFLIRVSYMEIYNEVITDLLKIDGCNLKVRNNEKNEVFVEHLSEVPIASSDQAFHHLQVGERQRRFGETNMNEKSSRSHTIFRVIIESRLAGNHETQYEDNAVTVSQLNLVDLAGSERASQTGAQGTRLKESGFINKSLLTLGTVISKLSSAGEERSFIPYRDSKLTRILQNSLGGNAMTSVIATVTPAVAEETLSTLKFASRAKTIKNQPKVNEVVDGDTMIKRYRKEINMLKKQIDEIQATTGINHLKMENEKMELMLEEYERKRREQTDKISTLQNLIISAENFRWNEVVKPARRETWCPGKLKRSLASRVQSSSSEVFRMPQISSASESEEEEHRQSFCDDKSDFLRVLEKEERRSMEELKRKRSGSATMAAPKLKYRRSYQCDLRQGTRRDQECQTEVVGMDILELEDKQSSSQPDHVMLETLQNLKDENTALGLKVEDLQSKVLNLQENNENLVEENDKLNCQVLVLKDEYDATLKDEQAKLQTALEALTAELTVANEYNTSLNSLNLELNEQLAEMKQNISIEVAAPKFDNVTNKRRRKEKPHLDSSSSNSTSTEESSPKLLQDDSCQTEAISPSPSKSELMEKISLVDFEYFEKDCELIEVKTKLDEAKGIIQQRDDVISDLRSQLGTVADERAERTSKNATEQSEPADEKQTAMLENAREQIKDFNEELDRVKQECLALSEGKVHSDNQLVNLLKDLREIESELADMRKSSGEKDSLIQHFKGKLEEEMLSSEKVFSSMQEEITAFEQGKIDLVKELEEIKSEKTELERRITALKNDAPKDLQESVDVMEGTSIQEQNENAMIEGFRKEKEQLEQNIEEKEKEFALTVGDCEKMKSELGDLQERCFALEENKQALENELDLTKQVKEEFEMCIAEKERKIDELLARNNDEENKLLHEQLESLQVTVDRLEEDKKKVEDELFETRKEKEELIKCVADKERTLEELQDGSNGVEEAISGQIVSLQETVCKLEESERELKDEMIIMKQDKEKLKAYIAEKERMFGQLQGESLLNVEDMDFERMNCIVEEQSCLKESVCKLEERRRELESELSVSRKERDEFEALVIEKERLIDEIRIKNSEEVNSTFDQLKSLQGAFANVDETVKGLEEELIIMKRDKEALEASIADKNDVIYKLQADEDERIKTTLEKQELQEEDIRSLEEKKKDLEDELDIVKKEKESLEAVVADKERLINDLQAGSNEELRSIADQLESLQGNVGKLENDKRELEGELAFRVKEKEELEASVADSEIMIIELQAREDERANSARNELESLQQAVGEHEEVNRQLEKELNLVKDDKAELETRLESKEAMIQGLQGINDEFVSSNEEQLQDLQKVVSQLKEDKIRLEEELELVNKVKEELEVSLNSRDKLTTEAQANVSNGETEVKLAECEFKIAELELTNEELQDKLNEMTAKIESGNKNEQSFQEQIQQLEEQNAKLNKHLSMLSDDLQSAEDENMGLLERINVLSQSTADNEQSKGSSAQDVDWQSEKNELVVEIENVKQERDALNSDRRQLELEIESIKQEKDDLCFIKSKNEEKLTELVDDVEKRCRENQALMNKFDEMQEEYRNEIESINEEKAKQYEELKQHLEAKAEFENKISNHEATITSVNNECKQLNSDIGKIAWKIKEKDREVHELSTQIQSLTDERDNAVRDVKLLKEEIEQLKSRCDKYEMKNVEHMNRLTEFHSLQVQTKELDEENQRRKTEMVKLQHENNEVWEKMKALQCEHDELVAKYCTLEKDIQDAYESKGQLEQLQGELEKVKKENDEHKKDIAILDKNLDFADRNVKELVETIQENEKTIAELKKNYAKKDDNDVLKKLSSATDELNTEKAKFSRLMDVCTKQKSRLEELSAEKDNSTSKSQQESQALIVKVGQMTRQYEEKCRQYAEQLKDMERLKKEKDEAVLEVRNLRKEQRFDESAIRCVDQGEVQALRTAVEKAKEEKSRLAEEISRLEKENEQIGEEADEEMHKVLEVLKAEQDGRAKDKKAFKAQTDELQKKLFENEEVVRLREELETTRKDRFDKMCSAVSTEKENQRLAKELEEMEKAVKTNEQYQENRVANLKNELKRLREEISSSSSKRGNDGAKVGDLIEKTAVFSLKLEKANLERESNRLKETLEDVTRRNKSLSLEKCDFESKYNALKIECFHLKRGLRGVSKDAGTQTLKEQFSNIENKPKGKAGPASANDKGFLAPDLYPFKEEKEDPSQCAQQ